MKHSEVELFENSLLDGDYYYVYSYFVLSVPCFFSLVGQLLALQLTLLIALFLILIDLIFLNYHF